MVVLGAGGFAHELIDTLIEGNKYTEANLFFFDEVDTSNNSLYGFKVLHSVEEVKQVFKNISNEFCLGVGSPKSRYDLYKKFEKLGGEPTTVISTNSDIGNFDVKIGKGTSIMSYTVLSNNLIIGKGTLVNTHGIAGHNVKIGDFCDIAPGVKLTGYCQIGNYVTIGTSAVILPKVKIGDNSLIAAGTVVANDVPKNSMVVGILPSRVVKQLPEFEK